MKQPYAAFFFVFLLISCATTASQQRITVPIDDAPQRGPANAPVTIIEFLDYT
jgi:hypothetical protein